MSKEANLRLHRCCFTGQRPEKLNEPPEEVKQWLEEQIDQAVADGYTTFISGCAMGVDIWAGQIVLRKKKENAELHLIAATPWPGFASRWSEEWQRQYSELLKNADLAVNVCTHYHDAVFQQRNEWMVDRSNRVIAFFNGAPGGTRNTIDYAQAKGIEVVTNNPDPKGKPKKERKAKEEQPPELLYPENIITDIGIAAVFGKNEYVDLSPDQIAGLEHIMDMLPGKESAILRLRYQERQTLQACGDRFGFSRQRAQQVVSKAIKKLRNPSRTVFIRDGFEQAALSEMIKSAENMKNILRAQRKRYPLMTEEDIVKLVFQGMLGVGHLISSEKAALDRLHQEMCALEPDENEPLTEKVSPQWFRLNLRAAKAKGISEADIAYMLCQSAKKKPLNFTRQNVYNFCVKLDGSDRMKAAAEKVLEEGYLPSHSQQYREAYHPAYRVLHIAFRKLEQETES